MPVDHPLVAVEDGGRAQLGRVGAGDLGLGHREERARRPLDERPQEPLLLVVGSEHVQDLAVARVGRLAVEDELRPHAAADLLVQERVLHEARSPSRPPPAGRCGAQIPAAFAFARSSRDQRVRRLVLARERRLVRIDVLLHERAHLRAARLDVAA